MAADERPPDGDLKSDRYAMRCCVGVSSRTRTYVGRYKPASDRQADGPIGTDRPTTVIRIAFLLKRRHLSDCGHYCPESEMRLQNHPRLSKIASAVLVHMNGLGLSL